MSIEVDLDLDSDRPWFLTFSEPDLSGVLEEGGARNRRARQKGRKPKAVQPITATLGDDLVGILGEAAVAEILHWDDGRWNPGPRLDRDRGDVAGCEVRTCHSPNLNLIVRPQDPPGRAYIHVVLRGRSPEMMRLEIVGWTYGCEAQQPEFAVQPDNRRPGFYAVPRGRLRPMRELWLLLEDGAEAEGIRNG